MKIKKAVLFLAVLLLSSGLCFANRDENMEPAKGFFLPKGDAAAGKKAFMDLKCFTCHQVENSSGFNHPLAAKPGPVLGKKQADYANGWIANSIVSPSHTIAFDSSAAAEDAQLSPMGDFTETMTVRQMIDLVAYIRSLGGEKLAEK